jgi:EAL domain-containing protein (putative c-di-GMP-specific phosphodiesterase class I)
VDTGTIAGAAAVLRWAHPTRGALSAAEFVPLAEQSGLIGPLGRWVLEECCSQLRRWLDEFPGEYGISVHVSGRQVQDAAFVDGVRAALARYDLPPHRLVLGLTESVLAQGSAAVTAGLAALRATGARIAMDDSSTGFSGFGYVTRSAPITAEQFTAQLAAARPLGPGPLAAPTTGARRRSAPPPERKSPLPAPTKEKSADAESND